MFEIVKAAELREGDWLKTAKGTEEVKVVDLIVDVVEIRSRVLSSGFDDPGGSMDCIRLYHLNELVSRWAVDDSAVDVSMRELGSISET